MKKLPEKKSELIRLAVSDLEKCEADPNEYTVDMNFWHSNHNNRCHVCFAGAVMAKTEGVSWHEDVLPPDTIGYKSYEFLNSIRMYEPFDKETGWNYDVDDKIQAKLETVRYDEDPETFKSNMLQIANWYEEIGE